MFCNCNNANESADGVIAVAKTEPSVGIAADTIPGPDTAAAEAAKAAKAAQEAKEKAEQEATEKAEKEAAEQEAKELEAKEKEVAVGGGGSGYGHIAAAEAQAAIKRGSSGYGHIAAAEAAAAQKRGYGQIAAAEAAAAERKKKAGMEVIFSAGGKPQQTIVFEKRPIGFDFHPGKVPIVVDTVIPGSYAQELGVQSGWAILKINGEEMSGKDYDTKLSHLISAIKALPQA